MLRTLDRFLKRTLPLPAVARRAKVGNATLTRIHLRDPLERTVSNTDRRLPTENGKNANKRLNGTPKGCALRVPLGAALAYWPIWPIEIYGHQAINMVIDPHASCIQI